MSRNDGNALHTVAKVVISFIGYMIISLVVTILPALFLMFASAYTFNAAMEAVVGSVWVWLVLAIVSPLLNFLWNRFLLRKDGISKEHIGFTGRNISNILKGFAVGCLVIALIVTPLYILNHIFWSIGTFLLRAR